MNSLNEDQRRYLDQEATQYAIDNARRYQRAMEAYLSGEKELPRWITQLSPIYRRALASHCGISGDGVE